MKAWLIAVFVLAAYPALAEEVSIFGKAQQGGLVFGQTQPDAQVILDGTRLPVGDDGAFLMGFSRDAKPMAELTVVLPGGRTVVRQVSVAARKWDIQRIDGLPPKQVTPDPKALKRIKADNALIGQARRTITRKPFYRSGFLKPVDGRLSGVFGSQRILNGEPRSPHSGTDIAAPEGTPIGSFADGVVSLVHDDMFYTGKTVMVDHGFGLQSVYAHMSAIKVVEGQWVPKGAVIGEVGRTGRVTGAHLHFGISHLSTKLDPMAVLEAGATW